MTSTEEIAPERMAAAVSTADHCQTGPLGSSTLADLRGAAFLNTFAAVDFFCGDAFFEARFLPITVFLATSHSHYVCRDGKGVGARCRGGCSRRKITSRSSAEPRAAPALSEETRADASAEH